MAHALAIERMSFGERLAYAFRERQIYVRSEGQVRFITPRPWIQISFVLLLAGVVGWIAYATLTVAFKDYVIAAKKRQFANVQTVYEDRITQMLSSVDQLNGRLLLNQDSVESQLENVRDVQTALEIRQRQIAALMSKQFAVAASELAPTTPEGPQIVEDDERTKLLISFEPVQSDIRYSRIPGKQSALGMSDAESTQAMHRLGKRLRELAAAQRAALNVLETRSAERRAALEEAIASLGFKPGRFAPNGAEGLGGPLVRLADYDPDAPASPEERQVQRISETADAVTAYVNALQAFPLRKPLASIERVASSFGPRRDPFTGVKAMHQGVDFPKMNGSPVFATAPGKVKKAGWGGAYGRLVEISHDNGVSTRYAHLSKIDVKVGDLVESGQEIGLVGTTGRSTGSHLHYETRLNGKAVNPNNFFKVASNVFQ
jgi:murein DD-endopeptidase MepM/ murein hydrolase activator NlpD